MKGSEAKPGYFPAAEPYPASRRCKNDRGSDADGRVMLEEFDQTMEGLLRDDRIGIDQPNILGSLVESEANTDIHTAREADIFGISDEMRLRIAFFGGFK